jgi:hypothetical protein
MYMLIAYREGKKVECVPGFTRKRDAQCEARRLNALPPHWRDPDGHVYHRPYWTVTVGNDPDRAGR